MEAAGVLEVAIAKKITKKESGIDACGITLGEMIDKYIEIVKPLKPWGLTKEGVLQLLKKYPIAQKRAEKITAKHVIDHIVMRAQEPFPQTAAQDYMYIRQVFSVAEDLLGVKVKFEVIDSAQKSLSKIGAIGKSKDRERRPEIDEISTMVALSYRKRHSRYYREGKSPWIKSLCLPYSLAAECQRLPALTEPIPITIANKYLFAI